MLGLPCYTVHASVSSFEYTRIRRGMKESRSNLLILTSFFPLGPLWLIGIIFIYEGGMHFWAEASKGDDVGIAILGLFCVLPLTAILAVVSFPLIFDKLRQIFLPNLSRFTVVIPLIGILVYATINAIYSVKFQSYFDVASSASWKNVLWLALSDSLYVTTFERVFEAPPAVYPDSDKLHAMSEVVGEVLVPLIATTIIGAVLSLLVLLGFSSERGT